MDQLVDYIVRGLVDQPDAVRVDRLDSEDNVVLQIYVAEADVDRVRGKEGLTLEHITSVVTAASGGLDTQVKLIGRDASEE